MNLRDKFAHFGTVDMSDMFDTVTVSDNFDTLACTKSLISMGQLVVWNNLQWSFVVIHIAVAVVLISELLATSIFLVFLFAVVCKRTMVEME